MPLRFEAHTYPGSGTFEKKFDIPVAMPGSAGVRELSAWSDESFMVPASYSRLPELVSETSGSWIKVFKGSKLIDEFDAARVSLTAGKPNTRTVSGPQRNGLVEGVGILPKDYPNHKDGSFDWKWGADNIMPDLSLGALGSIREEWEVWHDHTSGSWNADVDGDDNDIAHDAPAGDVEGRSETLSPPGTGLQGLTTVDDVTVDGAGTEDDPYVIVFYDPPAPSSVSFTVGTLSGGTTFSATKTVTGALDPSPITKSKPVDAGAGSEAEHGDYGEPPIQVVLDNLDTDADWALRVNAWDRYAGSQIVLNVTPGQTYSNINIRVKPTVSGAGDYTLVLRDIFENKIKNTSPRDVNLSAGSYQDLTIDSVTIPDGVDQIIMRVATTDASLGSGSRAFYVNWQGATFLEGDPEATWTQIVRELLEAAQDRGAATNIEPDFTDAADTLGIVLSTMSFTQFVGDNAHLGQTLGEGREKGFHWQISPADDAQVITPAGTTTHVLQIYKVDADEIEDLTATSGGPTVTVGGVGVSEAQVVSRRIPFTTLIGLGTGNVSAEDSEATAEGNLGRIERVRDVEHLGNAVAVQDYLDAQFAEQALNLKAATATVLETASQIPGVDYGPGSKIWWQFPGILDKEARPVKRFSWTHGLTAQFRIEGSRILTGEAAVVSAVDMLLRKQGRRRDHKKAPSPTSLLNGGGAQTGAHIHVLRATTQSIGTTAEAITWTLSNAVHPAKNFAAPSYPTSTITIQEPGYYDIEVAFALASAYDGGGSVTILRNDGVVWPPVVDSDIWTTTSGRRFSGTAKGIECLAGDTISVKVGHNDASAVDLEWAQASIELVDRILNRLDPWELVFSATDQWGVTSTGTGWWTTNYTDGASPALFDRDENGTALNSYAGYDGGSPNRNRGIVYASGSIYGVGNDDSNMDEINPSTGGVVGSISLQGPTRGYRGVGFNGTNLFVTENENSLVEEYSLAGSLVTTHAYPAGHRLKGLGWDGEKWWATTESGAVIRMDTSFNVEMSITGPSAEDYDSNNGGGGPHAEVQIRNGFLYVMTPVGLYRRAI